ncbi:MAG: hypothetical protein NTW03_16085 [Verrucomicrobia bacterium]|nr:hypothetical protein [Verrucomicrobiota bacterium]
MIDPVYRMLLGLFTLVCGTFGVVCAYSALTCTIEQAKLTETLGTDVFIGVLFGLTAGMAAMLKGSEEFGARELRRLKWRSVLVGLAVWGLCGGALTAWHRHAVGAVLGQAGPRQPSLEELLREPTEATSAPTVSRLAATNPATRLAPVEVLNPPTALVIPPTGVRGRTTKELEGVGY